MYNRDQFLDNGAKDALANHKREQEERKLAMLREQKMRELKELETQLFYKKEEIKRIKATFERLKRELVARESTARKEQADIQNNAAQVKDTESRLQGLEHEVTEKLSEINDKIGREKNIMLEHQRVLDGLEKQKRELGMQKDLKKRGLMESMSRLLFYKKKEGQEAVRASQFFDSGRTQAANLEKSLQHFTQEATVLENKIRSMRTAIR